MDWIEAVGETRAEAESKLMESLNVTDIDLVEIGEVKVTRKFLGVGGKTFKVRGRLKESAAREPAPDSPEEEVTEPGDTEPMEETTASGETDEEEVKAEDVLVSSTEGDENGIVTSKTKYRPWAAEGPAAIVIPPEGKGYGILKYSANPVEDNVAGDDRGQVDETEERYAPDEDGFEPVEYEDDQNTEISEEDRDRAVSFVQGIVTKMDIPGTVKGYRLADRLLIQIDSEHGGLLIGRKGGTLESMQYLADIAVNRAREHRIRVILDTENYRDRRKHKVRTIALDAADSAVRGKRPVRLLPMTPAERQIVHTTLGGDRRVETQSEGQGARRRVVVFPKGGKKGRDRKYDDDRGNRW